MIQLLAGDCRDVLPTLAADSVQCVVCSPPYYGLRDYGTALWDGGDAACDHQQNVSLRRDSPGGFHNSTSRGTQPGTIAVAKQYADTCGKCGATRIDRQIGLEATPDEYLATMVAVFREIRRVMRNDAVAFINMGDGYSDKQLLMMPARLALALQADGWWLRSDIIWHKPNPMPESVTDRPTSAHEHVFLLTKRSRYFYDADAVREPHDAPSIGNRMDHFSRREQPTGRSDGSARSAFTLHGGGREYNPAGRSCRNVWTIATHAYPNAHFATYPPELAERCIRAGTSERGACSQCGAPWGREVEKTPVGDWRSSDRSADLYDGAKGGPGGVMPGWKPARTTGWSAGCQCGTTETRPCVVLDPFAGAGTTLLVADRLQRNAIGIELNPDYTRMAMQRCQDDAPLFTSFPPASDDTYDSGMRDLFREAAD